MSRTEPERKSLSPVAAISVIVAVVGLIVFLFVHATKQAAAPIVDHPTIPADVAAHLGGGMQRPAPNANAAQSTKPGH